MDSQETLQPYLQRVHARDAASRFAEPRLNRERDEPNVKFRSSSAI